MVLLTRWLLGRSPRNVQPDPFWKKRQILKFSAHFYGRKRNCNSVAIRAVQKSLQYLTYGRTLWKRKWRALWEQRISGGTQELGYFPQGTPPLLECLSQNQILLNRQTLASLAVWEPASFRALNKIAAVKGHEIKLPNLGPLPKGVIYDAKE